MRPIPSALQEKLSSGVTTLARCWIVTRRDGVVRGYTDHDRDLIVDGVTCVAGAGLSGSEARQQLGLAIGGSEIAGALSDDTLNEDELAAGRYDAAAVNLYLVDWSEPSLFVILAAGTLGEVRREGAAFVAEVRGPAHRLARRAGASTRRDALPISATRAAASTSTIPAIVAKALPPLRTERRRSPRPALGRSPTAGSRAEGWSGRAAQNEDVAVEVKLHRIDGASIHLDLWQAMPEPIAPGDTFVVTAGCDKRFPTCRDRFSNAVNFRGFPHIPGNDFVVRYPVPGEPGHSGGSLQA